MASLVLGAVGGFFFGPIGFAIGSMVGSLLFPPQTQGPRLTDLKLTNSSYGVPIPLIYGAMRVTPNIIWQTDLHEHEHGGKGGPSVTTFSYTASFAMQLCANEIEGINRIWWNGTLIWNADGSVGDTIPCTVYFGTETQLADPTMEAVEGVGNVPGYRGTAYVVFNEYDLTSGGNTIGNWSFEVIQNGPPPELSIVTANYATGYNPVAFDRSEVILNWDANSIVVSTNGFNTTSFNTTTALQQMYDPATFAATGTYMPPPAYGYPNLWVNPSPQPTPVGIYVYANGTAIGLWAIPFAANTATASLAPILTPAMTAPFDGFAFVPQDNVKFLHAAGVPDTGYLIGAALTEDGTQLFVFIGPTSGGNADTWYKIVDGTVAGTGTVSPSERFAVWGSAGIPGDTPHIRPTVSVENNGQYFWFFNPTSFTTFIYVIDETGNLADWGHGTLQITNHDFQANGFEVSVRAIGTGYAGLATGDSLVKLTRFGPIGGVTLAYIVGDLSARAGLVSAQIDVTALPDIVDGYLVAQQMSSRDAITPLQSAWYFDAVERAGVVTYVKRGGVSVATIPDNDLAAQSPGGQPPPLLTETRAQEVDLPAAMTVKYVNEANDYQTGAQISQRQVTQSQLLSSIELAINMTDGKAKQVANTLLFMAWWERSSGTALTSRQYCYLEPTDVVNIRGVDWRIANKNDIAANIEQFDLVRALPGPIWNQGPTGVGTSGFTPATPTPKQQAQLILMDIAMITDLDHPNGLYAAVAGVSSAAFSGANVYKSVDGGSTYNVVGSTSTAAVIGATTDALGDFGGGNVFDEINSSTVVVGAGGGELASATEIAVLNGTNVALLGSEIIQYKSAVLTAPSTYVLSGFLRGRRGTEVEIPNHVIGEQFVSLPDIDIDAPFNELAQVRQYKAVGFGLSLDSAAPVSFINYGAKLRPYSPADLGGGVDASGNMTINWARRTRVGGAWADYTDVTLSEPSEAYVLQIWDAHFHKVARIVNLIAPTFIYTAAMQTTDFGGLQLTVSVSVGQVGTYTLGAQASAIIPGGGGSNTSVITPIPPYNNPPPQTGTGCTGTVVNTTMVDGVYCFSGDGAGGPNWTWVLKFTTGSITAGVGKVIAFAGSGDQLAMGGTLTNEPCGFPLPPTVTRLPLSSLVQFNFYMTGNPNPGKLPTLLPSTDYYLCVTRPAIGASMSALLQLP